MAFALSPLRLKLMSLSDDEVLEGFELGVMATPMVSEPLITNFKVPE